MVNGYNRYVSTMLPLLSWIGFSLVDERIPGQGDMMEVAPAKLTRTTCANEFPGVMFHGADPAPIGSAISWTTPITASRTRLSSRQTIENRCHRVSLGK
jgi:hypothetical protein